MTEAEKVVLAELDRQNGHLDVENLEAFADAVTGAAYFGVIRQAVFEAEEALECLRRGHGIEASALCYPALNTVRQAAALLRGNFSSESGETPSPL
jgi:hypothetical protein